MPSNRLLARPGNYRSDRKHQAVCADCSASTTVPFLPTQNRPVYCSPCFKARRDATAPPESSSAERLPGTDQRSVAPASGFAEMGLAATTRKPCSE